MGQVSDPMSARSWGTSQFFNESATMHFDDNNNGHGKSLLWGQISGRPSGGHCWWDEGAWMRRLRDEGHVQYFCGQDTTTIPAWNMMPT